MEVSALKAPVTAIHGRSPLLRLQTDERLVDLTRRGNQYAFEALVSRYQSRLLAFCRHMLSSKEDAEDVLQEVFAASFNAMLADERTLNVRPWLYRIARNRCLNHLRRVQPIGVDSMDIHFSEGGQTTADKVHKREEFRLLMGDVQELPETQRTALLLREIDALSYDQISEAMETTVPSVKSLLVRARVALAEAAEARQLSCEEVRLELGEVAEGLKRTSPPVRRHLRTCDRCAAFRQQLKDTNKALAMVLPVGPLLLMKKLVLAHLGTTATAGSGSAAGAAAGAGAGATASGALSAGMSAVATKAAAGIAAAALVTAGAVEVDHATSSGSRRPAVAAAPVVAAPVHHVRVAPVPIPRVAHVARVHRIAAHPAADKPKHPVAEVAAVKPTDTPATTAPPQPQKTTTKPAPDSSANGQPPTKTQEVSDTTVVPSSGDQSGGSSTDSSGGTSSGSNSPPGEDSSAPAGSGTPPAPAAGETPSPPPSQPASSPTPPAPPAE